MNLNFDKIGDYTRQRATWRKPRPSTIAEPPMLQLRETISRTKTFFHKGLKDFRSLFSGGYQKLPRSFSFNPFLCRNCRARTHTSDKFYNEFYDLMQSDIGRIKMFGSNSISRSQESAMEDALQESIYEESSKLRKKEGLSSQNKNKGAHVLAQKMKELDMMDTGDLEHVLDIEEALHYYSRLKSGVYLDIVDKFFMDINSEFTVPQPSARFKHSKGKLGPIQLQIR